MQRDHGHLQAFAETRSLSRAMVSYGVLFQAQDFSARKYGMPMNAHFHEEWVIAKAKLAEKQRASEGGPTYYVVRRHRVGRATLDQKCT